MAEETASTILKPDVAELRDERPTDDFSQQTKELLDRIKAEKAKQTLDIQSPIFEEFFVLEKKCRDAQDARSGSALCSGYLNCLITLTDGQNVVEIDINKDVVYDPFDPATQETAFQKLPNANLVILGNRNLAFLTDQILLLLKKRGQLKRSVITCARFGLYLLPYLSLDDKLTIINSITKTIEGKMFVEVERARLLLQLSLIKEHQGLINEAATILQEVQVETFGGMDRDEKTNFILKQMILLLSCGDFIRCHIASKKINPKLLEDMSRQKVQYYKAMTTVHLHDNEYLESALCFKSILLTPSIQAETDLWKEALEYFILFLSLSEHSDTAKQLRTETLNTEQRKLRQLQPFEQLLSVLAKPELIEWPLPWESAIRNHSFFTDSPYSGGEIRWKLLRQRIIQHNLGVLSKHYVRIRLSRIASLLHITIEEAEQEICNMVCNQGLKAKIDRPLQVVKFGANKSSTDTLTEWSDNLNRLLDHLDTCCHMINKERLVHAARSKVSPVRGGA